MTVKTFMHLTLLLTESNKILKSEFELTLLNYSKIKKTKLISLFAKSVLFFMYQRDLIMRLFFVIKSLQSRINRRRKAYFQVRSTIFRRFVQNNHLLYSRFERLRHF